MFDDRDGSVCTSNSCGRRRTLRERGGRAFPRGGGCRLPGAKTRLHRHFRYHYRRPRPEINHTRTGSEKTAKFLELRSPCTPVRRACCVYTLGGGRRTDGLTAKKGLGKTFYIVTANSASNIVQVKRYNTVYVRYGKICVLILLRQYYYTLYNA